ncbi:MAG: LysR family transcriptional regulator [Myxococcales bacterium]|nr:LysR family transcriptional regulator [Myxococcales bacterium]MCB9642392.1 LysR family transcriptional regulator [Myxococcales bacterium]
MQEHLSLPSLDGLQYFLAAAEHGNFRRAAEQMHITAAALGQRIKQLEQQLGTTLFLREPRAVKLTEAGHRLIDVARATLRQASQCRDVVHAGESLPLSISLGTRFELGMSWVLPGILALQEQRPQWKIDLYFGSGPDLLEQLQARRVDCIVTSAPVLHKRWTAEFLHTETYLFVGAPDLLQRCPFQAPQDARHHTLLDIDESLPLTRYLTSATGELSFGAFRLCGAGSAIHYMLLRGLGVAVLPHYMVRADLEAGRLQQLLPDYPLLSDSFRLIFSRDAIFHAQLRQFANFLRERPLT